MQPETIASYRDAMRLLLTYAEQQTGKPPFQLDFDDLDPPLIGGFLTTSKTACRASRFPAERWRESRRIAPVLSCTLLNCVCVFISHLQALASPR